MIIQPEFVDDETFVEAIARRQFYQRGFKNWVLDVMAKHNVSRAEAEAACKAGIQLEWDDFRKANTPEMAAWYKQVVQLEQFLGESNARGQQDGGTNADGTSSDAKGVETKGGI